MATPLELRNRKKEAQRTVRLALNATHSALDAWKRAVAEGKQLATQLTNAVLTQGHLPGLDLGALAGIAGLREAAAAKLGAQQAQQLDALSLSLAALEAAVSDLRLVACTLQELLERERAAPILQDRPVFAALSLPTLCGMWGEVVSCHDAELGVKRAVVSGFEEVVRQARPGEDVDGPGPTGGGRRLGGETAAQEAERRRMTVYLSAWMLSPEVDEGLVEAHLAALAEDMRGL